MGASGAEEGHTQPSEPQQFYNEQTIPMESPKHVWHTVDGSEILLTSWGNGSLSHCFSREFYIQVVQDFWTINSISIILHIMHLKESVTKKILQRSSQAKLPSSTWK